jgi:hypothetical protein
MVAPPMQPSPVMRELIRAIDIDAPAETVWQILTDLPRFSEWNPFIREARGRLAVGGTVKVRAHPPLGIPLRFQATVLACEENRELRWRGQVLASWLASGEHCFTLEPAGPGRVRFVQREIFGGLLPRLARWLLERQAGGGFDAMNRALKARAEAAGSASSRRAAAI